MPEFVSDRVMAVNLEEKEWRAGPEVVQPEPGFYRAYPPDSELKRIEGAQIDGAEDDSQTHRATSGFLSCGSPTAGEWPLSSGREASSGW